MSGPRGEGQEALEASLTNARRALSVGQLSLAAEHLAAARSRAETCVEHAQVLDTFGALLAQKQDFKQALAHHLQAARICRESQDDWDGMVQPLATPPDPRAESQHPISEARYLANVGALAQVSDKAALAEGSLARAYWLLTKNPSPNNDLLLAEVAHNLGVFLMNVGKVTESLPFLERSLELDRAALKAQNNAMFRRTVHSGQLRLAAALRRHQKPESHSKALAIAKESLELAADIDAAAVATSLLEIGALHFARGDLLKAMEVTNSAINGLEEVSTTMNTGIHALQLGRAYVDMAIYARHLGRKAAATQSLNRAIEQANFAKSPALTAMIGRESSIIQS
jgi:tetratricopeptide (TPR) repeat protein